VKESKKEVFQSPPGVSQGKSPNDNKVMEKENGSLDIARYLISCFNETFLVNL
jgi:hypothetical protein